MSKANLVEQLKELLKQWEDFSECLERNGRHVRRRTLDDCIDDLKGILPPEEEE